MAMRDPGSPGRNPFFEHDAGDDGAPDDPVGALPSLGAVGGPDPLRTLASLVDALQEVQPEATEHLVTAAHELVLAVKCVVDATEAVLAAQLAEREDGPVDRDEPPARPASGETLRRIDLS
jgi:hypothetical protein